MNTNIISGLINCLAAIFSLLFVNIRVHSWLKFFPWPADGHKPQNPLLPGTLKVQAQSEMQDAWVAYPCHLAELRGRECASGVVPLGVRINRAELRVVKGVVGLGAELDVQLFVNANVLEKREVPVVYARAAPEGTRRVAERQDAVHICEIFGSRSANARRGEDGGVEILLHGPLALGQIGIAAHHGAPSIAATREIEAALEIAGTLSAE